MTDEITEINRTLYRCDCGSRAVMRYDPGCTFIHCLAEGVTKSAAPDWQPEALAAEWNAKQSKP